MAMNKHHIRVPPLQIYTNREFVHAILNTCNSSISRTRTVSI